MGRVGPLAKAVQRFPCHSHQLVIQEQSQACRPDLLCYDVVEIRQKGRGDSSKEASRGAREKVIRFTVESYMCLLRCPIVFSGPYSQESVYSIAALQPNPTEINAVMLTDHILHP